MAAYHSLNLGKEVMRGLEFNAQNGLSTGGKPPLGYDIDPETLKPVINKSESKIVQLIFKRYGEDGYTYSEIVDELNEKGYRTKRGNEFKKNSLTALLRNEKYIGVYTYNKAASKDVDRRRNNHKFKDENDIIRKENSYPRIISNELWEKVQRRMKDHNVGYSSKYYYPLKDKIICGECKAKMGGNTKPSGMNRKHYTLFCF